MSFATLVKRPTGYVPVAMSIAALLIVLGRIAMFGTAREADEGTTAHLWQLLMVAQLPVVLLFAIKWLPLETRPALLVLALQASAGLAALALVYFLGL
jgi:hypothetical protein